MIGQTLCLNYGVVAGGIPSYRVIGGIGCDAAIDESLGASESGGVSYALRLRLGNIERDEINGQGRDAEQSEDSDHDKY